MFHWTIFLLWSKAAFVDFFDYAMSYYYKYVVTKIHTIYIAALEFFLPMNSIVVYIIPESLLP